MFSRTIIALIIAILAVNIHALQKCSGPSSDSQDEFQPKYDAASIVAYGEVASVQKDTATFTVKCTLKGSLSDSTIQLTQLGDVLNETECHYLKDKKQYVVFLESMKTNGGDGKTLYRLANMEEIEINTDSVKSFLEHECDDEEDFGIEMTIYYYNNNLKCNSFTATCNQATKGSILALSYPPLTTQTTFLGGYKKKLAIPKMNDDGSIDISGKQLGGTGDEQIRNSAMMAVLSMPLMAFFLALIMKNHF